MSWIKEALARKRDEKATSAELDKVTLVLWEALERQISRDVGEINREFAEFLPPREEGNTAGAIVVIENLDGNLHIIKTQTARPPRQVNLTLDSKNHRARATLLGDGEFTIQFYLHGGYVVSPEDPDLQGEKVISRGSNTVKEVSRLILEPLVNAI